MAPVEFASNAKPYHICPKSSETHRYGNIGDQGSFVQSIVRLTSSVRGQLVKCFTTS